MAAERVYVFLVVRKEGKPKKVIVWDTPDISVGRAPENDVVVEDSEASREHATFYKSDAGYSVRNQSLSNQTNVNGQPVNSSPLQTKDVVTIAETEFLFYKVAKNPVTLGLPVEYASQLKYGDIVHYFAGMNAYRSLFLGPPARYGEAFQDLSRNGAAP